MTPPQQTHSLPACTCEKLILKSPVVSLTFESHVTTESKGTGRDKLGDG